MVIAFVGFITYFLNLLRKDLEIFQVRKINEVEE